MPQFYDLNRSKSNQVEESEVSSSESVESAYPKGDTLSESRLNPTPLPGSTSSTNKWLGALQRTTSPASKQAVFRSMQSALGNRSSTVIARLYNQAKGVIQRVLISGYNMSAHSLERASERGISKAQIKGAIDGGTKYDDGTDEHGTVFYLGDLAVVTGGSTIITVYRTPKANSPKARWTAL